MNALGLLMGKRKELSAIVFWAFPASFTTITKQTGRFIMPHLLLPLFSVCICLFIGLGCSFELRRWGLVGRSLVPACQHALIWMFLFYFVCLFVCVCILCSVVYQDGFYGADIYVSIIYWYIILHATPPSPWFLPCCFAHATSPPPALHTRTWLDAQLREQIAACHIVQSGWLKRPESRK